MRTALYFLMRKFQCGNCSTVFKETEGLCEDWRDPKKSLVCPHCKFYLEFETYKGTYETEARLICVVCGILLVLGYLINQFSEAQHLPNGMLFVLILGCSLSGLYVRLNNLKRVRSVVKTHATFKAKI